MATVKAVLNRDRVRESGVYALVIQIIHKRVKRVVYTPYRLKVEEFDKVEQRAIYTDGQRHTHKHINEINRFVEAKKKEFEHIIEQVSAYNKNFITEDLIIKYHLLQSERYLVTFMEHLIAKKESKNKMGVARAYRSTLSSLRKYIGRRTIEFTDIDHNFVKGYHEFLIDSNAKQNTIGFYLRNFRAIYNMADDQGIDMGSGNAFAKIKIKTTKTVKRALKQEAIEEIALMDLSQSPQLDTARDLFMFSFYTRGMSFVDIIYLRHSDIIDGVIYYRRRKTDQLIEVAVTAPLQKLIDKYNTDDTYVLPFINRSERATLYGRYHAAYAIFYHNLNSLQKRLNLTTPLTTYVARHSWATIAKELGTSVTIISEGLGHTSEKITQIYLKEFDRSVIDMVNAKIVSFPASKYAAGQKKRLTLPPQKN